MKRLMCVMGMSAVALMPVRAVSAQRTVAVDAPMSTVDARRVDALLATPVTVDVDRVSLRVALDAIAKGADIRVQYRFDQVDLYTTPVTLHVVRVPLGTVFSHVLSGTHLRVVPLRDGSISIVPTDGAVSGMAGGQVIGTVVDSARGRPLARVTVTLTSGAFKHVTVTDAKGEYQFTQVPAGKYVLSVRSLGFTQQARSVTVVDDETATVSFALAAATTTLDQVVVTATGEQRVRELGHVVAQINADSLVKSAPISNMVELLQSRVPGLQVTTGSGGVAGGGASLRIRSATTGYLDQEPIIIVDGVRFKSSNTVQKQAAGGVYLFQDNPNMNNDQETRSLLDDLNPNDIETVEVVKGPSASTLYGPDAANGVIIITTKRGAPGKTEFKWYARPVSNSVPLAPVSRAYQAYSHDPSTGDPYPGQCWLIYQYEYNSCVLDSIAPVPTLAADPRYSTVSTERPQWQYGASVSGGSSAIRYFLSGNYDSQLGAIHLSPALAHDVEEILGAGTLSQSLRNPNAMRDIGGHANVVADFGEKGSLSAVVGYTQTYLRSLPIPSQEYGGIGVGIDTTSLANFFDVTTLITTTETQSTRFDGSLNGTYRPWNWLNLTATIGTDLAPSVMHQLLPYVASLPYSSSFALDSRRTNVGRTATASATAEARQGIASFRSSLGVQYTYTHLDGVDLSGLGLAPGSSLIQTASTVNTEQLWQEQVSLGTYAEEVVGLRDRLFLTGSLRVDGSTSFGDKYHPTPYPKVGLSWIASEEPFLQHVPGLSELRFRSSFGAASRYPISGMKLGVWTGGAGLIDGTPQTTLFRRTLLGNPLLSPERTREAEFGADATLFSELRVGLTWNRRRTIDMLAQVTNAPGLPPTWVNVGTVEGRGFEATASAPLFVTRAARGDLQLTYSHQTDKVLALGAAFNPGAYSPIQVGYPLEAVFGQKVIGVADTVGGGPDSIAFDNEVILSGSNTYLGSKGPPTTLTLSPSVTVLDSRLRISALFDRQTGFVTENNNAANGLCLAAFFKSAPLIDQARCLYGVGPVPGNFTRWRELTATYTIPERFLRLRPLHLAFSQATVSLQGRDLKLWTKFDGDPESFVGAIPGLSGGLPQARAWSFRFDVTP